MTTLHLEAHYEDIGGPRVNITIEKDGHNFYIIDPTDDPTDNPRRLIVQTEISKRYRGSGCQYCFHFEDATHSFYGVATRDSRDQYANANFMRFMHGYLKDDYDVSGLMD